MNLSSQLCNSSLRQSYGIAVNLGDEVKTLPLKDAGIWPALIARTQRLIRQGRALSKEQRCLLWHNAGAILLLTAGRQGAFTDDGLRELERNFGTRAIHLRVEVCRSELQLLRELANYAARIDANTPEILRDPLGAWAEMWLISINKAISSTASTKSRYEDTLRKISTALKRANSSLTKRTKKIPNNPFHPQSDVVMHEAIQYAWMLAEWDEKSKHRSPKLRKHQGNLRKSLKEYQENIAALVNYLDSKDTNESSRFFMTAIRRGQLCVIGDRNKTIALPELPQIRGEFTNTNAFDSLNPAA